MRPSAIVSAVALVLVVLASACSPRDSQTAPGAGTTPKSAMPSASAASQ